jgi:vacuolar protein sorting-associated protein 41
VQECEVFNYYDELVYLYSKTGQMKRALFLIIDRLRNVHKAIEFAMEQDDADLWEDLLTYSMDKPSFIRGLLEHAGTAFDPINLVRRIPEGLEIPGLREGLTHMMKEQEIGYSISHGAAKVLSSEVAKAQKELRTRQRKAVKFEILPYSSTHIDAESKEVPTAGEDVQEKTLEAESKGEDNDQRKPKPGHCAKCMEPFTENEMETLLGYSCGHVFHLSHLLELLQKGRRRKDVDLGFRAEEGSRYSVTVKVTRARLLRDRVQGGCPLCHKEE